MDEKVWVDKMQVAWRRGSWRACLRVVSMCECVFMYLFFAVWANEHGTE